MQRPWAVRPNQSTGVLSREALIEALVDAATMLDIAGGCLEVVVGRAPTDVPGEMVMTGAMLCWKDRTDARPQPETAVAVTPESVTPAEREATAAAIDELSAREPDVDAEAAAHAAARNVDTDGFDYDALPDEDIEPAPEPAR